MDVNQYTFDAAYNNGSVMYPSDCERIRTVAGNMGINITPMQAQEVWERHSGVRSAQWLHLQDDEEIKEAIHGFICARLE